MNKPQIVRPQTVEAFQKMLAIIFTSANRRYSDNDLLLRLVEEISVVMEIARKDELDEMPSQLARTYSWTNAVATRLKINLQEALWNKYPNVCPYCLRVENCLCAIEHPDIPNKDVILRRLRLETDQEPEKLSDHQALHRKLYARQNRRILLIQTAAHLAEEAGEVSKEFRHHYKMGMQNEIADVISWIFAVANRCGFEMSEVVWVQYPFECERCFERVCGCQSSQP